MEGVFTVNMIVEQDAFEVIQLMLENNCQIASCPDFNILIGT